jgi:hypothetical protein
MAGANTVTTPTPPQLGIDGVIAPHDRPEDALIDDLYQRIVERRTLGSSHRDLIRSLLSTVWELCDDENDVGDVKIADAALSEMAEAFRVFSPYRSVRKMTMFGSARTRPDDPVYHLARDLAAEMAQNGWMVVTGAGPGIMAAGAEGAGREHSFGVNIRLPHEEGANPFIAQDPKLVQMRYFFTRKLMLVKESHGYAFLPGGFGTQDECYELLTLLQTGKAEPAPVVMVETEGGDYWQGWLRFVHDNAIRTGYVSADDESLFTIATTAKEAADEIFNFYANYHSCRFVGDMLVLRLKQAPSKSELASFTRQFSDIIVSGEIRSVSPFPPEISSGDHVNLPRIAFRYDKSHYARLRLLIDALNELVLS